MRQPNVASVPGPVRVAGGVILLAVLLGTPPAAAQRALDPDRPGIDYYPAWMHEAQPFVSGRDQDYPVFRDGRFDREDPDFREWRDEQRRTHGPDWRNRPGVQEEYRVWRDGR